METITRQQFLEKSRIHELREDSYIRQSLQAIANGGKCIKPVQVRGRGKYRHYVDWSYEMYLILDRCGIGSITYNIAPRGGKLGTIIEVRTKITD
jgi:hypothetical protein